MSISTTRPRNLVQVFLVVELGNEVLGTNKMTVAVVAVVAVAVYFECPFSKTVVNH